MENYCLYWIHYPEHTSPESEGYIGITKDFDKRILTHSSRVKSAHIKNRINSGAIPTILHEGLTKEQAEQLEEKYRPSENIGWNIAKGGNIPPSRKGKISPKTLLKGDDRTIKQKESSEKLSLLLQGKVPSNAIEVTLFDKTFTSISKALIELNWSKSHYYKYLELIESGMTFENPEQLKEYTWKLKNEKISKTRKERGYHYNQYTNK